MSVNRRVIDADVEKVWEVLADGWLYPLFVVGASRMREVDDAWPAVGTKLHHSVGAWPVLLDDETEVLESEPRERLRLVARGWPMGEAEVTFELEKVGAKTEVTIHEKPVSGPGRLAPPVLRDLPLGWRNTETLRRLAFVAERR